MDPLRLHKPENYPKRMQFWRAAIALAKSKPDKYRVRYGKHCVIYLEQYCEYLGWLVEARSEPL